MYSKRSYITGCALISITSIHQTLVAVLTSKILALILRAVQSDNSVNAAYNRTDGAVSQTDH